MLELKRFVDQCLEAIKITKKSQGDEIIETDNDSNYNGPRGFR